MQISVALWPSSAVWVAVARMWCYPDPAISLSAFLSEIMALADRLAIEATVPATDLTTMLLVSQPELSKFSRLAGPTKTTYETLTDEARLLKLAARLGVPISATQIADTATAVGSTANDIGFPAVLKPARSGYLKGEKVLSASVQIVGSPAALTGVLRSLEWLGDVPCVVQRFVLGHGAAMFALYEPFQSISIATALQ